MADYTLKATKQGEEEEVDIPALDDLEATIKAIRLVMDKGYTNQYLWGSGLITLTDANGLIVHQMDEKE